MRLRNQSLIVFCFVATLLATPLSAQDSEVGSLLHTDEWRRALLNKPYAETMDSLEACLKRMEAANIPPDDEAAAWNDLKAFAVARHDERLALSVDFYLAYNQLKGGVPNEKLIAVYQKIIDRTGEIDFRELMIRSMETQANLYFDSNNYEEGFALFKHLEKQMENISDELFPDKIRVYYAIASIYLKFHDYEPTKQLLKKAIEIPIGSRNLQVHLSARNTMGIYYMEFNQPDSAEFYFRSIVGETRYPENDMSEIWKIIAQKNIAEVYALRGEYGKAIPIYKEVFDYMSKASGEYDFATGTAISLADAYLHTGKIREAEALFSDRLKRERISDGRLLEWYEVRNLYYQQTGKPGKALAYVDSIRRIEKTEYDSFNTMRLLRMEQHANALDMQLKDEQIARHQVQKRNLRIGSIILAIALLVSFIALAGYARLYKRKNDANLAMVRQIREMQEQWKLQEQAILSKPLPATGLKPAPKNGNRRYPDARKDKLYLALHELMLAEHLYRNPNITREKLAARLGANKNLLIEAIQDCFGTTLPAYLNNLRLKDAISLLEKSDLSLEEIAGKAGFGTLRSFQRQFRIEYGMSISDYRKHLSTSPPTPSPQERG